jgi:hypothetical protein
MKIIGGAMAVALVAGPAVAAARMAAPPWIVTPTDTGCRVDLELTGGSGAVTPVSLTSDGQLVSLRFAKDHLPSRAFLPIRIDGARFSNLMLRDADGSGELVLSEETEAAMRRGATLDIAWLSDEPLSGSLAGSGQGLADLRVCGAQTAARHREAAAADQAAHDRAEAEARAKALNEAQLAAVQAQAAAAEAQRRQVEEAAERQRRAEAAQQERAYQEARQRAYEDDQRRRGYYEDPNDDEDRWAPPRPAWPDPYDRRD